MKISRPGRFHFLLFSVSLSFIPATAAQLNWQKVASPEGGNIQGLAASGDTVVATTALGDYYRSSDGGKNWSLLFRRLALDYGFLGPLSMEALFLGDRILGTDGEGSLLLFYGGRTDRILLDPPDLFPLHRGLYRPVRFFRQGNGLFALSGGIYASADSGKSWTFRTDMLGDRGPVSDLAGDGTSLYAMNGTGDLFASQNQGQAWSSIRNDLGREVSFGGLTGLPGGLLAWWQDGEILRLRRQGDSLAASSAKLPGRGPWTVRSIGSKLFASGSLGISQSPDGGLTWTLLTSAPPDTIQTLAEIPGGNLLAGTRDGLYLWNRITGQWSLSQAGLKAVEIQTLAKQEKTLLALGHRTLHRSADGGVTWHRLFAPGIGLFTKLISLSPDFLVINDSGKIFPVGPSDTLGKDISREFPVRPQDLGRSGKHWVTVAANGVSHISHDNRKTWSTLDTLVTFRPLIRMAMQGSRIILQGPRDSVRYSLDTGYTWKIAPPPVRQNLQMTLSGKAWLATGGLLYRTEDPAASWETVAIGQSGAWVQSLVGNETTLYAVTDIGLSASEDHGSTWESVVTGMLRGEFETLKTGATALWAKTETGTWWVAGLEDASPTNARTQASPSASRWPRLLCSPGRSEPAILNFHLTVPGRLYAYPVSANGRRLAPALHKKFESGRHEWVLPSWDGLVFWNVGMESPSE